MRFLMNGLLKMHLFADNITMASTKVSLEVNNNHSDSVGNVSNLFAKIFVDKKVSLAKIIDVDSTGNADENQQEFDVSKNEVASHSVPTRPSSRTAPHRLLLVEATPSRDGKRMRDRPRGGRGKGKNDRVDNTAPKDVAMKNAVMMLNEMFPPPTAP